MGADHVAALRHGHNQLLQSFMPLRCHQPEFGQVGPKCVDQLSSLADQELPRPVQELCGRLGDEVDQAAW